MKLFRITLIERNETRTIRTWSNSVEEARRETRSLLPFSKIENITEVTVDTLIIKR